MSLFQAREWWSVKPDGDEETHQGNMCVANIDNAADGADKLITGSFQGLLRIYYPRQAGFRVTDLMLEQNLEEPILQLDAGRFSSNTNGLALAVLHPRRLVVYTVSAMKGQDDETSYYDLKRAYVHNLDRTAYNFCFGHFGGGHDQDYICVQSMDGQLQLFEQERLAFSRFLNDFLCPGPLCYVPKLDSFVTINSNMGLQCYKYQMLSSSSGMKQSEMKDSNLVSTKKVQVDWSLNLGEAALALHVARFSEGLSPGECDIVVLGERTLFTVTSKGDIRSQKKLDFNPSCLVAYAVSKEEDAMQNLIMGNYQQSMMIYKDTQLVWAARLQSAPVCLAVGTFGGVRGFVCSLNDECQAVITYMGTDPPMQGVNTGDNKDLDYEAMDAEHKRLLKVIRQANTGNLTEPSDKLTLRAQIPDALFAGRDEDVFPNDDDCARNDQGGFVSVMVKLFVGYTGRDEVNDVSISLKVPPAFMTQQTNILLPSLRGGNRTPLVLNLRFRVSKSIVPCEMTVPVVAAYTTATGEPRTARTTIDLPMLLCCYAVPPLKNCQYMFTLDTNRPPPSLIDLFGGVLNPAMAQHPDVKRTAPNVMTIIYYGSGLDVTILVSKKSGRYRLQSGSFEALSLMTRLLVERMEAHFKNDKGSEPFTVSFKELLPLHDYFVLIDKHHEKRVKMQELRKVLEDRAHQFRVVQKRLLVRFKDKNPTPLSQLDVLFNDTYNSLLELGDQMQNTEDGLKDATNHLVCATQLMVFLIRFKYGLDEENFTVLNHYLSSTVTDSLDQGWEEVTDAAMTHLLRTVLAKNARDSATVAQPLKPLEDTTKFKRHIQIVCDRLQKGLRLVPLTGSGGGKAGNSKSASASIAAVVQREDAPIEPSPEPEEKEEGPLMPED